MASGMASSTADKVCENRLRRVAERRGYVLVKCRRRDPRALGYGRYALVDVTAEDRSAASAFARGPGMTLGEVAVALGEDVGPARRTTDGNGMPVEQMRLLLDLLRRAADDPDPVVICYGDVPVFGGRPVGAAERRRLAAKLDAALR
jgi:hypothetical protein